nr:hypothetical protein [Nostoc sp. ChiSLP03a]
TWSEPTQTIELLDAKFGKLRIRLWTNKHFRLSPHHPMSIILVERLQEDDSPRVNKPMWLAFVGQQMPPLAELWKLYLQRFAVDHWYRFIKQRLHWTLPKLSTPQQCDRWSDLMPIITWELWLARDIVSDNPLPWQRPIIQLTPGRVAQAMPGILLHVSTPARAPKPPRNESSRKIIEKWHYLRDNHQELDPNNPLSDDEIEIIRQILIQHNQARPLGVAKGELTIPDTFDSPLLDEILDSFYSP